MSTGGMRKRKYAEALKAASEAATAGPWIIAGPEPWTWGEDPFVVTVPYHSDFAVNFPFGRNHRHQIELLLMLRNAAPEIIAVLEAAAGAAQLSLRTTTNLTGEGGTVEPWHPALVAALDALDAKVQP